MAPSCYEVKMWGRQEKKKKKKTVSMWSTKGAKGEREHNFQSEKVFFKKWLQFTTRKPFLTAQNAKAD